MRKQKVLCMAAAAVLALTACSTGNTASAPAGSEEKSSAVSQNTEGTTLASETGEPFVDEEGFTHSIVLPDEGKINIFAFSEGQNYQKVIDKFEQVTKDTLKTKVNFQFATSIKEEAPLKLAAKEDIDMIFDAAWANSPKNIKDGMYMDITRYFNNPEYPGLQQAFSPDVVDSMKHVDGKVYGIPYYNNYAPLFSIYIRGDWREKYNLPKVTDMDTLYQYLDTIDAHKEELGITSSVGLYNRGWFYFGESRVALSDMGIFEVTGTGARASQNMYAQLSEDGKTVLDARMIGEPDAEFADWKTGENFLSKRAIELGTKWHRFVNSDAISLDDARAGFESGLYGAIESEIVTTYSTINRNLTAYDPDAKLEFFVYDPAWRNKEDAYMDAAFSSNYMYIPYYCDDPDRVMAVVDWIFESQANNDLWTLGIEGEDWKAVGEDKYEELTPDNKYVFPTFLWSMNPNFTRRDVNLPDELVEYLDYASDSSKFKKHPFGGFSFDNSKVQMEHMALTTLQEDYYHQFLIGDFGDETQAKLEEFDQGASDYEDAMREEVIRQLQEYINTFN